jgi:hypothetical protein
MKSMKRFWFLPTFVLLSTLLASCGSGSSQSEVLLVPEEYPTIQAAVDKARAGDLVLVSPGVYEESVKVDQEQIVIRGLDRNEVVIDGGDELINGFEISADSVAIENMTVKSFRQNGIVFSGALREMKGDYGVYGSESNTLDGYRVSYVTSYNNGLYGIYAFASKNGLIEHSYASGHPDSGLYVGQCRPCNVVIRASVAENNAIGYYGTNASTNVWVVESVFRGNRLGITPNSQDAEMLSPQKGATIAANLVEDNDNPNAPPIPKGFFGGGIVVGGGLTNLITKNLVQGHSWAGIAVMSISDVLPAENRIIENKSLRNETDLLFIGRPQDVLQNCFQGNKFSVSTPRLIEQSLPCDGASQLTEPVQYAIPPAPPGPDYRTLPAPTSRESMPNARTAPVRIPMGEPVYPSLDELKVPSGK